MYTRTLFVLLFFDGQYSFMLQIPIVQIFFLNNKNVCFSPLKEQKISDKFMALMIFMTE